MKQIRSTKKVRYCSKVQEKLPTYLHIKRVEVIVAIPAQEQHDHCRTRSIEY